MSTSFYPSIDPYKAWLQVTIDRRPLNAYQLLGLQLLETSRQKIDAAIARQRMALDLRRDDADPTVWEKISNEVEEAGDTLCDIQKKAVLDASIRRQMASAGFVHNESASLLGMAEKESKDSERAREAGISCRRCQKVNLADRKFCAGCGQALWEPCPNCKTMCAGGERFCGGCGTDVHQFLQDRGNELHRKLDQAQGLHNDNQFEAAVAALREVAKIDDPRFDEFARKAAALIDDFAISRRQREGAAGVAFEKAQILFKAHSFDEVINTLESVSQRLLSKAALQLLADARTRWKEICTLNNDIRAALDSNRMLEALPKIERLLTLKPDHEQARKLGTQIGLRLCKGAKKLLSEHRFEETLKLLRQIPSFAVSPEVDTLLDQATEMTWMLNEVKSAPLANAAVISIAERLLKIVPQNEELKRIYAELLKRTNSKNSKPWLLGPLRKEPPASTLLGMPIHGLVGLRAIKFADGLDDSLLRENPGRFFVACGLALQGLGQAVVNVNLALEEKKSLLSTISLSFRKKEKGVAWGIDLGSTALKAVKLVLDEKTQVVRVEKVELIELPPRSDVADADMAASAGAEDALQAFVSKHTIAKTDRLCVNLPGLRVLGRFLLTPPVEPKKLDALIEFEARKQIPYPMEELAWDYACADHVDEKSKDPTSRRVVIIASKLNHTRGRLSVFERAKLKVDILQSDSVALHNFLQYEQMFANRSSDDVSATPAKVLASPTAAILDIGGDSTNIIVSGQDVLWFRTIGLASDEFAKPIMRTFNLTHDQVEKMKREPSRAKRISKMYAALEPQFVQLTNEIQRSLATFENIFPENRVAHLYGLGGGFQLHGLLGHLWGTGKLLGDL